MMTRLIIFFLLIFAFAEEVTCKKLRQEISEIELDENASGKRTLMIGKLVLLPILAGVGVKFLVLLPIILSKIALLGILSFVSSNLSLLVSAVLGVRSYFFDDKPTEDHDYNHRNQYQHQFYQPNNYDRHKDLYDDHRHHGDDYDEYNKYMPRYKGYKFSHSGHNPHYAEYRDHDDHKLQKKRFRPFKLLGRIKDVIKDHFLKSEGHGQKYREYDHNQKHNSHKSYDNHDKYNHELRETKYRNSEHLIANYNQNQNRNYYEAYVVPENWSQKNGLLNGLVEEDKENKKYFMNMTDGSSSTQLDILVDDAEKLANIKSLLASSTTGLKIEKDYGKLKKPFIVLGIHPHEEDSNPLVAFYATDEKITDFHTLPQPDTSK